MSEMVDAVAKALAVQAYGERDGARLFGDNSGEAPDVAQFMEEKARGFRWQARAAITAMRDPTVPMRHAGADTFGITTPRIGPLPAEVIDGQPTKAWQAMIDEALL